MRGAARRRGCCVPARWAAAVAGCAAPPVPVACVWANGFAACSKRRHRSAGFAVHVWPGAMTARRHVTAHSVPPRLRRRHRSTVAHGEEEDGREPARLQSTARACRALTRRRSSSRDAVPPWRGPLVQERPWARPRGADAPWRQVSDEPAKDLGCRRAGTRASLGSSVPWASGFSAAPFPVRASARAAETCAASRR
jgi:hypothetical protein